MFDVSGGEPPCDALAAAAEALRGGGVVVLPTDTVYGVAALPAVAGATDRIFALKGRTADVPLAVLCAEPTQALGLADPDRLTGEVRRIAATLWPGPLTLVLPRRPGLGYALGEPDSTVGVRCPDHPLVRTLAAEVGPIAATSANRHGQPTPATALEVIEALGGADAAGGVAVVLDGGPCGGTPSTVVDATTAEWRLLRQGALSLDDLRAAAAG